MHICFEESSVASGGLHQSNESEANYFHGAIPDVKDIILRIYPLLSQLEPSLLI